MRLLGLVFWVWLSLSFSASACDIPFPARDSVVQWPERILVAKVKVLRVNKIGPFERYARVRLVEAIRGEFPRDFGIRFDTSSCGSGFTQGDTRIAGFTLLRPDQQTKNYRFNAHSRDETWARAVYVDGTLILAE